MLSIALKDPKVKAKLVNSEQTSCLVAKFANSQPPMLWQFDLERNHSFTLTVRDRDEGAALGFLTPQGDFTAMATFPNREEAEEAMAAVQKALMRQRRRNSFDLWRWFWVGVTVLILVFCFSVLQGIAARKAALQTAVTSRVPAATAVAGTSGAVPAPAAPEPKASMRNGVPLPADDLLTPPTE